MTGSSRASANRGSSGPGLVVMGCASEDAESLHEAVDALRRDGLEVELCDGLEDDPKRLSDVIDRHQGRGLYVLCRSPQLGRERVEELREILLARHVPFARTLTVAVGGRGALADRIRAGLRRASARTSGPHRAVDAIARGVTNATEDEEPTLVGKREGGVPEELELVPSQPLPLPPRLPRVPTPAPMPAPSPAQDSVVEAIEVIEAEGRASEWSVPTIATDLDLSDLDNTGPTKAPPPGDITAPGQQPALITGNTAVGPAPGPTALITGDTVVGAKLPRGLREAAGRWPLPGVPSELEPATTPFPRMTPANLSSLGVMPGSSSTLPASLPPPPHRAAPTSLPAPGAATSSSPSFSASLPTPGAAASSSPSFPVPPGGAASSSPSFPAPPGAAATSSPSFPAPPSGSGLGFAGSSSPSFAAPPELEIDPELELEPEVSPLLAGPPPSLPPSPPLAPPPGPAPAAWASASAASASFSHADEPVDGRGKLLPWILGAVALSLLVLVIALALSTRDGSAEVASGDEPAADDAPSKPSPSESTPADGGEDQGDGAQAEEPSLPPGGVYPVVAALEARKVRALDVLLVATTWGKPANYSAAAAYCEGLDVEGVKGWRLPLIGELHSLAQANMISRGMFWSSTSADTFGDGHMAWNARRGYALPYAADAVAVCVRGEGASGS